MCPSGSPNPNHEHFDKGLWGYDGSVWEKLLSVGGRLSVLLYGYTGAAWDYVKIFSNLAGAALHGYDGSTWQKLALLWGYSDRIIEEQNTTPSNNAEWTLTFTTVPSGKVWHIHDMLFWADAATAGYLKFEVNDGSSDIPVYYTTYPTGYISVHQGRPYLLKTGDTVKMKFDNANGVDCYGVIAGYEMDVS